ncbi:MAG: hypothetical protein FWH37_05570 [Candidatus Bathyarchaeota archaeon]|nr:hypothetical protein [Candidatus Termiticorpusculum sp.]
MIYTANFHEMAGEINHVDIAKYLKDLGWKELERKRSNVKVFQLIVDGELYQANIPTSRSLIDYNRSMYKAVEQIALSTKKEKSVEHVLLELLNPLSDIIRFHVKADSIKSGTIMFEDAIILFENAKKLVTYAAMDLEKPSEYHTGVPSLSSREVIKNCRFGQTEVGNYIVSIVLPFVKIEGNKTVQLNLFGEEADKINSITRQITNKIMNSIQQVKDSIKNDSLSELMKPQNNEPPLISANFLEALNSIGIYKEKTEVNISVKWAPTVQVNKANIETVSITDAYYKPIEAIVNTIKHNRAVNEQEFLGRISKLQALPDVEKRKEGEISLVYLNPDTQRARTATVVLKKEDYQVATEAHADGKTVRIIGRIAGQRSKNIKYSSFEVV